MGRAFNLTGEQIRAARAIARIEQAELARRSELSLETIKRLERIRGPVDANIRTLNALSAAFDDLAIAFEFDGGVGVRRRETSGHGRPAGDTPTEAPATTLFRLIYYSTMTTRDHDLRVLLEQIGAESRPRARDRGLTGALFVSRGRVLQALEGEKTAVLNIFGAIASDPRHTDLHIVERREIRTRQFPDWTLSCGLFDSDETAFAAEPSLWEDFAPEALSPAACIGVLSIARELNQAPPRNGRLPAVACPMAAKCLDPTCRGPDSPRIAA